MVVVPDRYAEEDLIGYSDYGEGLVQMVRSVQSDGSFTIGVFGQWGQGKTSMLRQIKHALDESQNEPNKSKKARQPIITAWFNPWQFTKEDHIIIPFFHTLVSYFEEYQESLKYPSANFAGKLKAFFEELVHVPVALAYGFEMNIKIPLLLETKFRPKEAIEESRRFWKKKKNTISETDKLLKDYQSRYYRLITRLEKASKELGLKIVVFIDDLDRCLPEKAIELLEGIKVLLDIPGFVFVIGVARDVIERGIRVRYHELYRDFPKQEIFLEQDYLDKIIQFPFNLPAPDTQLLHELVGNFLKDVPQVEPYLPIIHKALGNNPRCLKRFVNNLSYTFWVANSKMKKSGDDKEFHPGLLVKMTLIAFQFSHLYNIIGKTPSHLLRIQEFLQFESQQDENNKLGKLSKEEQKNKLIENNIQDPESFFGIEDLHLFKPPKFDTITIILGSEPSEKAKETEENLLFKDEDEVRKYVSLLTATSKSEESLPITSDTIREADAKRMIKIPAGTITLRDEHSGNKLTTHIKEFLLDKYPLTQDLYREITGENPSHFAGDDRPVERVSWFDAVKFCNLLSDKLQFERAYQISGKQVTLNKEANGFRLPTEAEWEYACRAGTAGDRYGELDDIAWHDKNSEGKTHSVGLKSPNQWGLYDMLGNVWEWCWDWYDIYPKVEQDIWHGPEIGEYRVVRGGGWVLDGDSCRCAYRNDARPSDPGQYGGFRIARSL